MSIDPWGAILPKAWQILRSEPALGPYNMAVDATLLDAAATRAFGVWRTYAWSHPTISFGRNESARAHFDQASIDRAGLTAVRRPTGGRALLHAAELTYSVAIPLDDSVSWHSAYEAVNGVLLAAVRALGVPATLSVKASGPALRPDGNVCFAAPAEGEIVVRGAKLVGSAVWRQRGAYLQHGSILIRDDQKRLRNAMRDTTRFDAPIQSAAALADCLASAPHAETIRDALEAALRDVASVHRVENTADSPLLDAETVARHVAHFRDANWLWRR